MGVAECVLGDLERALERRLGQRMGVAADEARPVSACRVAVVADGLADRQNMGLVEAAREGRAAMARGAESHTLCRHRGIGDEGAVGADQLARIDELLAGRQLAGPGIDARIVGVCRQDWLPLRTLWRLVARRPHRRSVCRGSRNA